MSDSKKPTEKQATAREAYAAISDFWQAWAQLSGSIQRDLHVIEQMESEPAYAESMFLYEWPEELPSLNRMREIMAEWKSNALKRVMMIECDGEVFPDMDALVRHIKDIASFVFSMQIRDYNGKRYRPVLNLVEVVDE